MISVVTVYAPRRKSAYWQNYLPMLALQKRTCEKFGARQVIVTDADPAALPADFDGIAAKLPKSLMFALLAGQIAWLEHWDVADHTVFVDADVLIGRRLEKAFTGEFDIGLTSRIDPRAPINNGLMYIDRGAKDLALAFFRRAYALCADHWGGDQEAIAQAAAPVPADHGIHVREGARIAFLPCRKYNMTPGVNGEAGTGKPFGVHFKGDRKSRMADYARAYIL